ncbi:hypothetical protein KFL_001790100 [Klebsormidium nitens]|uniref:Uncharacterized protein n=1 Tax=Klebsormidium nitens TaxID=105231 RepID=A0A1Y1I2I5_KLENI|nr:hypothetical protein KFL_001790100 [Klebsormidium nitens]|eukprot:GAQ84172.1 hypothetical protein KFL_001790100 [Klebsormidium nitens]
MSLEHVVKGKLKLKGKELPSQGGIKKKKKKSKDQLALVLKEVAEERAGSGGERLEHDGDEAEAGQDEDHRTAAEKNFHKLLGNTKRREAMSQGM